MKEFCKSSAKSPEICEICVPFISRQKALQEEDEVEIYMFG